MTERQGQVVEFIRDYWAAHGRAPSYWEIAGSINHRSLTWLRKALGKLETRGVIVRERGVHRGVRVA